MTLVGTTPVCRSGVHSKLSAFFMDVILCTLFDFLQRERERERERERDLGAQF